MILAVEVLSPSTRRKDLFLNARNTKTRASRVTGSSTPRLRRSLALDLVDGRYVIVGEATGDESVTLEKPFPMTIVPSTLIR